jgi:perosamine synthetase
MATIRQKLSLIPRYNWDFGFGDLARALISLAGTCTAAERRGEGFARLFGRKPIFTGSGRASLFAILKSLGLPEGAGVGVPLFCCPVVFTTIVRAGFVPVFIDIDRRDFSLSADDLDRKAPRLSAIVVVHMFGHPADIDAIREAAGKIPIIEDCAQSLFSLYKEKLTGTLTDVSFFSFRSGKYLSAGEGSVLFCRDEELTRRIDAFTASMKQPTLFQEILHCNATYVKSALYRRPLYGLVGFPLGTRLDRRFNITAKSGFELRRIGRSNLHTISSRIGFFRNKIEKQRRNALFLLDGIRLENVELPVEMPGCRSNYYQFALRFGSEAERDRVVNNLWRQGLDCPKYLDEIVDEAGARGGYRGGCPISEEVSRTVAVIPNHYTLCDGDMERIVRSINRA